MIEIKFLNLEQTAEYLNLPLHYIYRLSAENRLPGKVCWGRRTVRVDVSKLSEWLNAQSSNEDNHDR